jgi:hypothetical protein
MEPRFDTFTLNNKALIDADITSVVVKDADGDPNMVLDTDSTFTVTVDWFLSGLIAPALGGQWNLVIYAEKIGPGEDLTLDKATIPLVPSVAPHLYSHTSPALKPKDSSGNPPNGTYQLSAVITHTNSGVRTHLAGFMEGPIVQFYTAP